MALAQEYPRFPKEEYARRHAEVQRRMRERGLDVLIIYGDSGSHGCNHANVKYLSNYQDPVASYLVVPLQGESALYISNRLYLPYARRMSVVPETDAVDYDPAGKVARRIQELGQEKGTIGLVGFRGILYASLPHGPVSHWQKTLDRASFADATDLLAEVRAVKSPAELAWFRRGAALTDMAFEALEKKARAGMTDFQLAALIAGAYMPHGGGPQLIFIGSTSMARPHLIFPNQYPSHRKVRKGDIILTELSADYEMHAGQAHRPIAVGTKPTPIYQRLFEVAVEAHDRILRALRPGATEEDVRRAASVIPEAGFTTFDTTFHGWGLLIEDPRVDASATLIRRPQGKTVFREGMLMVIQPNVVTADGQRGLQVGNLVEITRTGARSLQRYPMKFIRI
ncbi:MAG TPA: Xaa-Pro peptidase family protein [Methylomirabilota bacterium]|nr:Xaa-Pro peptidase family protein [Methylomirabilota bacterium]